MKFLTPPVFVDETDSKEVELFPQQEKWFEKKEGETEHVINPDVEASVLTIKEKTLNTSQNVTELGAPIFPNGYQLIHLIGTMPGVATGNIPYPLPADTVYIDHTWKVQTVTGRWIESNYNHDTEPDLFFRQDYDNTQLNFYSAGSSIQGQPYSIRLEVANIFQEKIQHIEDFIWKVRNTGGDSDSSYTDTLVNQVGADVRMSVNGTDLDGRNNSGSQIYEDSRVHNFGEYTAYFTFENLDEFTFISFGVMDSADGLNNLTFGLNGGAANQNMVGIGAWNAGTYNEYTFDVSTNGIDLTTGKHKFVMQYASDLVAIYIDDILISADAVPAANIPQIGATGFYAIRLLAFDAGYSGTSNVLVHDVII